MLNKPLTIRPIILPDFVTLWESPTFKMITIFYAEKRKYNQYALFTISNEYLQEHSFKFTNLERKKVIN